MKTLIKDNLSVYLFDDAEFVNILEDKIIVGSPEKFIISDCNSSNSVLYENVLPPDDWYGCKYLFDGASWSLRPEWTEPEIPPQP